MRTRTSILLTRWALITASIAVLLFLSAGTARIASIRNYLVAFSLLLLVTMFAVEPSLAEERANPKQPGTDNSRFITGLLFLLTLAVAGFSAGHSDSGFTPHAHIRNAALGTFILSGVLQTWAMIVNPFFSPACAFRQNEATISLPKALTELSGIPAISPCALPFQQAP